MRSDWEDTGGSWNTISVSYPESNQGHVLGWERKFTGQWSAVVEGFLRDHQFTERERKPEDTRLLGVPGGKYSQWALPEMQSVSITNRRVPALPTEQIVSGERRQSGWRDEGSVLGIRAEEVIDQRWCPVPSGIIMRTSCEGPVWAGTAHLN